MKKKSEKKSAKAKRIMTDPLSILVMGKVFPKNDSSSNYRNASGVMELLINNSRQERFPARGFPSTLLGISQVLPESFADILKNDAVEPNVAPLERGEDIETLLQTLAHMRQEIQEIQSIIRQLLESLQQIFQE